MEHRVNYLFLGSFVIGVLIATIFFVLWKDKYTEKNEFAYYRVVTKESVSGLNKKAPVKYLGVNVGEVIELHIDPNSSENVVITIKLKEETPIKTDSIAIIQPQGITGLSFLEISESTNEAPLMKSDNDVDPDTYPIIYTKPSLLSRLDKSVTAIVQKTEQIIDSLQEVVSPQNIQRFSTIMENTEQLTASLKVSSSHIDSLIKKTLETESDVSKAANSITKTSERIYSLVDKDGSVMIQNINNSISTFENLVPSLNYMMWQITRSMNEAKVLIEGLNESPSDMLFKQTTKKLGPGE